MEVAIITLTLASLGLAVCTALKDERRRQTLAAHWTSHLSRPPGEN
jgi:hypothetical protein